MQNIINFFRGSVRIEVAGAFPERFLNLCAQRGVFFWNVEWLDAGEVRLTVARSNLRRAETLGEKIMCTVTPVTSRGVPSFFSRFRKRYALLVGMTLSLAAVCILSQFVLSVEVSGNVSVPTAEIVTELRRLGVRPGVYGPGIDRADVGRRLLMGVKDLSWCAVNLHGTRVEVLVREGVERPKMVDSAAPGDVVAEAPGIITGIEVLDGAAAVKEGDTVLTGEVLITGNVALPVPEYSGMTPTYMQERAAGRVFARTWRTLQGAIPLEAQVKTYTGDKEERWAIQILGFRLNFYGNAGISLPEYDKITDVWTASLPSGREMPLSLSRETCRAYETQASAIDPAAAQTMLEERLLKALKEQVGDGTIQSTAFTAVQRDGMLTVTLTAECSEEIGKFVPFEEKMSP